MTVAFAVQLPREPRCGAIARRMLEERLCALLDEDALCDAKMVVSELVNNAYLHGVGAIELRARMVDHRLRIDVIDEGHDAVVEVHNADYGSRGLQIVDSLVTAWGALEGATHVWAELPIGEADEKRAPSAPPQQRRS
jgi:anti-sigma regulatory factor (Ser/Thr protein kinase)